MAERFSLEEVSRALSPARLYHWHRPRYQWVMLNALADHWEGEHEKILDIGGGTGLIAHAVQILFPPAKVTSLDVEDRFFSHLPVETTVFDGTKLPFDDGSFAAATINNVIHHVSREDRAPLMAEVRRVVRGPVYIKDHLSTGKLDHVRLAVLDLLGNLPFSGMLAARYLSRSEWNALARGAGYSIDWGRRRSYRGGPFALAFPNRLEVSMKWIPEEEKSSR